MKVNPDTTESSKLKGGYFLHSRPVQVLLRKAYRFYFARVSGRQRLFSGVYSSYEEALAAAPAGKPTIYDDSGFNYRANYRVILSSDYPILYWLSQLISSHASLADFGGNVGMAFYSYQKYLRYPDELHWVIYDLPQIIASALEVHAQEGCPRQLSFTTDIGEIDGTEIFLAAGSLQYLPENCSEILCRLSRKPIHLLLNKLPVSEGDSFFTLQSTGTTFCPYRVVNRAQFTQSLWQLGYRLVDSWTNDDLSLILPDAPGNSLKAFTGMYFRMQESGSPQHP